MDFYRRFGKNTEGSSFLRRSLQRLFLFPIQSIQTLLFNDFGNTQCSKTPILSILYTLFDKPIFDWKNGYAPFFQEEIGGNIRFKCYIIAVFIRHQSTLRV